jgi:rhodanese-related sulfurtransferase
VGVPTIVLVNPDGVVQRFWGGTLGPEDQEAVLAMVRDPGRGAGSRARLPNGDTFVSEGELAALLNRKQAIVLSIGERGEYKWFGAQWAVNIPLGELSLRAERDLKKEKITLVDCAGVADIVCAVAVDFLKSQGFRTGALDFDAGDVAEAQLRKERR